MKMKRRTRNVEKRLTLFLAYTCASDYNAIIEMKIRYDSGMAGTVMVPAVLRILTTKDSPFTI